MNQRDECAELNSKLAEMMIEREQARSIARDSRREVEALTAKIDQLYRRLNGELPEPDEVENGRASFTSRISYVEANPGVVYIGDTIGEGDRTPARVREFALALLAAANYAEEL